MIIKSIFALENFQNVLYHGKAHSALGPLYLWQCLYEYLFGLKIQLYESF